MSTAERRRYASWAAALLCAAAFHGTARAEAAPPAFTGIDHVTLNVADLAGAEAWYTKTLGFSVAERDPRFLILRRGPVTLAFAHAAAKGGTGDSDSRPGYFHAAFGVPAADMDAAIAALRASGTTVDVSALVDMRSAFFRDPEGNLLELAAHAPDARQAPGAAVTWLADLLLDHLEATDLGARLQRHLPLDRVPDLSLAGARSEADFGRAMLAKLDAVRTEALPHELQSLAATVRHASWVASNAEQDFWLQFAVTPYAGGMTIDAIHQALAQERVADAASRRRYLSILDAYAAMLDAVRERTLAQAERGIRVPQPALPGVLATLKGLRQSAFAVIGAQAASPGVDEESAAFRKAVQQRLAERITPAYDALTAVFDAAYVKRAPGIVGVGQYPGGKDYYRRRIRTQTGLDLRPEDIHALGLRRVAELDARLAAIRAQVGFKGDRRAFHAWLRSAPRFIASTPADVEARYQAHVARIAPLLPRFFATLPKAPYGVVRLDPAAEPGMTYGYYSPPTAAEPRGLYFYNGSNLTQRSMVTAAHLIYHELVPGHHLRLALAAENTTQHPLFSVLSFGAFEEGWAEYGAALAVEMGALQDPYDLYGHLLSQSMLATRLVVDTGMNYLGWSLERARRYMRDHTFESDAQIATETLRYSTDIPAQALGYRLGYEALVDGRQRAERALGASFDLRAFNTAMSNSGAMPLDVLKAQVDWFIARESGR